MCSSCLETGEIHGLQLAQNQQKLDAKSLVIPSLHFAFAVFP